MVEGPRIKERMQKDIKALADACGGISDNSARSLLVVNKWNFEAA